MRRPTKTAGDRGSSARFLDCRDADASTRSPASYIPRTLEAAIDAADLMLREPTEDGERIAVFCNALGGGFIYSREETERRIMRKFPDLAFEYVAEAACFLEDRVRAFLKPIQLSFRQKPSWIHGWRDNY